MHSRTRIKVCGITTVEDAKEAIRVGVDAIGFIFAEKSPRYISPEKVKEIVAQLVPFVHLVGVFVDSDPVEVQEIIDYCGLTHVQLHGSEDEEYCEKLAQAATPCRLLKAFRVGRETTAADFTPYVDSVKGYPIIESLGLKQPIILAGGISAENVAQAIKSVRPFAVDVNSGVEDEPGRKDHAKLQQFVELVRGVDRELASLN